MIVPALICGMIFTGCNSMEVTDDFTNEEGVYTGFYTLTYKEQKKSVKNQFTLELKNGRYVCGGDSEGLPSNMSGSGTYSIEKNKIIFNDAIARNNLYSWVWILSGEYNFMRYGKKLKLSKGNDYFNHEYYLEIE